jgi:methionyl-tRNA formyltransferase
MMLRVVFFGCELVGAVDVPPSRRASTNPAVTDFPGFAEDGHLQGISVFEPVSPNLPDFVEAMRDLAPDLFVAVGYTNLLKKQILSVPRILAANFHASLLPAYRGKHPVFWALRRGELRAGLTVHVIDAGLDTGDVLYQVRVRTRKRDSVASLYDRIMDRSVSLVGRLIEDAEGGKLRRTPQPGIGASYYSSVCEDDFRLDWSSDAEQLRRWIQTSPGQCFCDVAGRRVFPMDAEAVPGRADVPIGVLVRIGRSSCTVAAGKGALRVRRARVDQQGEQSMPQLCRELGLEQGDPLA